MLVEARHKARLADALLQGIAGDEARTWAELRADDGPVGSRTTAPRTSASRSTGSSPSPAAPSRTTTATTAGPPRRAGDRHDHQGPRVRVPRLHRARGSGAVVSTEPRCRPSPHVPAGPRGCSRRCRCREVGSPHRAGATARAGSAVLAFVHGTRWSERARFPKDSKVVALTLESSDTFADLYPTLAGLDDVEEPRDGDGRPRGTRMSSAAGTITAAECRVTAAAAHSGPATTRRNLSGVFRLRASTCTNAGRGLCRVHVCSARVALSD